jgi:hypothetical protein
MRISFFAAVALSGVGLAACVNDISVTNRTPEEVSVQYRGEDLKRSNDMAANECARYNKQAKLRQVIHQSNDQNIAVYDCRF